MHNFKLIRPFFISLCLVIFLFIIAISGYLFQHINTQMLERLREQAISYTGLIHYIKSWNTFYEYIYVEKKQGVESSEYLRKMGITPDVSTKDGRTFTIRNHAIVISEISKRSEQQDGVKFRITSLAPISSTNAPDAFERDGLVAFTSGRREFYQLINNQSQPLYRYMTPLYVEPSCLECHKSSNYQLGNVIGAVSLSIPARQQVQEAKWSRILIMLSALLSIGLFFAIVYLLTWRLAKTLGIAQQQLKRMATTDELTGLNNRRQIMGRLDEEFQRSQRYDEPLCLISLDIDHFKNINDTYGHPIGDIVLQKVAERLHHAVRSYDVVGRVGGEEFLVVAPATGHSEALALSERIIVAISCKAVEGVPGEVYVTASAGVAIVGPDDEQVEAVLKRADEALYRAKTNGRNQVA